MAYIDTDDLNNVWGTDNVTAWSDLTGGATADTTRIAAAIAWAEAYVENRFRRQSIYQVPFVAGTSGYDVQLTNWMAVLAGHWLYDSRQVRRRNDTEGLTTSQMQRILNEMKEALAGQLTLNLGEKSEPMPDAPACV